MPKRRTLSLAREELQQKRNDFNRKLSDSIDVYQLINKGCTKENAMMNSIDYKKLLRSSDQETIRQLEMEVEELEREEEERVSKRKARRMMYSPESSNNNNSNMNIPSKSTGNDDDVDDGRINGEEEEDGNDEEKEEEELEEEEGYNFIEEIYSQVRNAEQSNLNLALQGFRIKNPAQGDNEKDVAELDQEVSNNESTILMFECEGRTFHQNKCYQYNFDGKEEVVGITKIMPQKKVAAIVLVVPFSETFLGMETEGVDFKATYQPSKYVQVEHDMYFTALDGLGNECQDVMTIPELVYKPQLEGDWLHFAYYYKEKRARRGKRSKENFKVLDLFSGAGVMSQGLHEANLETSCAVEINKKAANAFQQNHPNAKVQCEDIKLFLDRCEADKKFKESVGNPKHVHSSSPCTGFSGANIKGGVNDEKNNKLSLEIVRAVKIFRPVTATFENVLGMWKRKHQHYLRTMLVDLMKLGYQVRCCQLQASEFGDAQDRPRLFIFAAKRCAYLPDRPHATHGKGTSMDIVTVEDAMTGLSSSMTHANESTEEFPSDRLRLDQGKPASTIRASMPPPIHYKQNRPITINELKALFSLPPEFSLVGSSKDQRRQIGNSVPVKLAEAVGYSIRRVLEYKYEGEEVNET